MFGKLSAYNYCSYFCLQVLNCVLNSHWQYEVHGQVKDKKHWDTEGNSQPVILSTWQDKMCLILSPTITSAWKGSIILNNFCLRIFSTVLWQWIKLNLVTLFPQLWRMEVVYLSLCVGACRNSTFVIIIYTVIETKEI